MTHSMEPHSKILIIDEIGDEVKNALETKGHRLTCARFVKEAFDFLEMPFDLVFIQQGLPYKTCEALIAKTRRESHTPVILMASKKTDEAEKNRLRIGADALICKPFKDSELEALMNAFKI